MLPAIRSTYPPGSQVAIAGRDLSFRKALCDNAFRTYVRRENTVSQAAAIPTPAPLLISCPVRRGFQRFDFNMLAELIQQDPLFVVGRDIRRKAWCQAWIGNDRKGAFDAR